MYSHVRPLTRYAVDTSDLAVDGVWLSLSRQDAGGHAQKQSKDKLVIAWGPICRVSMRCARWHKKTFVGRESRSNL